MRCSRPLLPQLAPLTIWSSGAAFIKYDNSEDTIPMVERQESLPYIEDIRNHINHTLCELEQLKPNLFPLTETTLWRKGKPCGMTYCLYGPRSVRLTAVWETDGNTILFYGSEGERVQRTHLRNAPSIDFAANQQSIANAA